MDEFEARGRWPGRLLAWEDTGVQQKCALINCLKQKYVL
jgi:hypothetical protein